jgi:hypothetical protein
MMTPRAFTVKSVIRSPLKAGSSAADVAIGPTNHVRVSTATVTRPSTSAVSACPKMLKYSQDLLSEMVNLELLKVVFRVPPFTKVIIESGFHYFFFPPVFNFL